MLQPTDYSDNAGCCLAVDRPSSEVPLQVEFSAAAARRAHTAVQRRVRMYVRVCMCVCVCVCVEE